VSVSRLSPESGNKELLEFQVAQHVNFVYSAFYGLLTLCGDLAYSQHMFKKRKLVMLLYCTVPTVESDYMHILYI
jgi:hypothetical protein